MLRNTLAFITSLLFAVNAQAFSTSGTVSANALDDVSRSDFYGPVDSASGAMVNVVSGGAEARSQALGSVSLALSAFSMVNAQNAADGMANWTGSFVNTTGLGQDFYAQLSFDRSVSGGATNATGEWVPLFWPGNVDAAYTSTLDMNVIVGGGVASYDAAALASAGGRVPLGFLAPGTSIDLAFGVSGNVLALGGQTYVCSSVEPGPNDCGFLQGAASALASGYITLDHISTVPLPAAAWLFSLGLIGLIGVARRKASVRASHRTSL